MAAGAAVFLTVPQGSGAKAGDDMGLPGQGGAVMNFPFRDFPWYFEDYNLDGQQDFFLGTCTGDSENYQSYHYLMTVTAEGEIGYLYDGPMWAGFWTLDAENITNMFLESGGGEPDYRTFFLYQMNREYSSHDYYTWEPYFGEYRKSVVFTGVYPQGQDREAADYLEGAWRVAGVDMWDQEQPRPDNRIGEVLSYENGSLRQLNQAGDLAYDHVTRGVSSLLQSKEEFRDTYNMLFPGDNEEPVRRILVNAGEDCLFGNVVYVVSENEMRVCDLENTGTFWTVIREDLRGEAREVQEYLQGTWEITGIASRPYDALEQEEAEAFLGTKLTYDWQNKAGEYAVEGVYNYSMPVLGFGRGVDNSANWPSEAGLMEGELQWQYVYLGEGEFFGVDLVRMDENRVWIYHMGTFFEAERVN